MGSTRGQEQSLGSGISLPQWMKGRMNNRFDFEQGSFSPPTHVDNFFYIRYPKLTDVQQDSTVSANQAGYRSFNQVLNDSTNASATNHTSVSSSSGLEKNTAANIKDTKNVDFSKHPLPCQPFISSAGGKESNDNFVSKYKSAKSLGTDDGFHGEPALCGKSIVHVAQRIISSKVNKPDTANEAMDNTIKSTMYQQHIQDDLRKATGSSKSLPVTPIASPISTPDTSPKSRRRNNTNRYFTGPFVADQNKYHGWILSGLLGRTREDITTQKFQEEASEPLDFVPSRFLNRKKSISSHNLIYLGQEESSTAAATVNVEQQNQQQSQNAGHNTVYRAKPSELREMNFWSPTSM